MVKKLTNKSTKNAKHEEGAVKLFLKNSNEKLKEWIIQKHPEQSSPIDIIAKNRIDNRIVKIQVRCIDDELVGRFYGGKIFFGERSNHQCVYTSHCDSAPGCVKL